MSVHIIDSETVTPEIPLVGGVLPLYPASFYDTISPDSLRLWCHRNARYGLPTVELVSWLKEQIGDRRAIEIGSGSGDLAWHMKIPATDNRMQEWPDILLHYHLTGQPTIRYPNFVWEIDALDAVELFKPEIVLVSWGTEWIDPDLPPPPHGGNAWGIKEDLILAAGVTYILIGNQQVHRSKKIMALPHEEHTLPFLRSRAIDPSLNRVWVWRGAK